MRNPKGLSSTNRQAVFPRIGKEFLQQESRLKPHTGGVSIDRRTADRKARPKRFFFAGSRWLKGQKASAGLLRRCTHGVVGRERKHLQPRNLNTPRPAWNHIEKDEIIFFNIIPILPGPAIRRALRPAASSFVRGASNGPRRSSYLQLSGYRRRIYISINSAFFVFPK